ncbi:MAG: YidC/Oxa1 family membrane protein insertase [Patescibacteria group bacterium]
MSAFFHAVFYEPLLQALVWLYTYAAFKDFGLAVIMLTILVRIVLFPLFYKGVKQQVLIQKIHPKIKEIQERHKDNKEKQAMELMELYKKHGVNPFSSILVLIIQLPIVIGLYQVILKEISSGLFDNFLFLGFIDVRKTSIWIAIAATILQYIQGRISMPKKSAGKEGGAAEFGKMMVYVGPALTLIILTRFASALGLYWITTTLFSLGQQVYIMKTLKKKDEEKAVKEAEKELKEIHHGADSRKN